MTVASPADALRACAVGTCTHEAGAGLFIANRVFLDRDDFTSRFIARAAAAQMTGPDRHNTSLVVQATQHATGHANFKTDKR